MNRLQDDYDPYAVEEPSDEEPALSSSEDEVDVLLHGTPDQKRKLIRECLTGESESSSEDEFEKEMEAELNSTMKTMEDKLSSLGTGSSSGVAKVGGATTKYYDEIYFDSDSEDEDKAMTKKKTKKQHRIPSNDELLYDPEKDNRDQAWVDARRRGYHAFGLQRPRQKQQPVPNSDAVLNCPACMTTLCLDCQRHESYKTQYRAMFVMNCSVNREEVLRYKNPETRKRRRSAKKMRSNPDDSAEKEVEEIYHPVMCTECSTEVAVYDKDEVFHFFNVLASHS
ncbi:E2F-associated phosphoprotein [Arvicanthis niloticus]|uniref:E2F-associated phosphoprotein n=1 Tax=Arvicanthis niloticus TaxID=61156 RepID=UPI0014875D8A|nr:E2F-associated phosphoprotein [Arvicanthis niloticus]